MNDPVNSHREQTSKNRGQPPYYRSHQKGAPQAAGIAEERGSQNKMQYGDGQKVQRVTSKHHGSVDSD